MNFLFWLLFIVDLLFAILVIFLSGVRQNFGAQSDLNSWLLIVLVVLIIASLVFRYALKMPRVSLVIVALPILGMFMWYLYDKNSKG